MKTGLTAFLIDLLSNKLATRDAHKLAEEYAIRADFAAGYLKQWISR
jgi:hypothetical protein